jgi:hypothetical protein
MTMLKLLKSSHKDTIRSRILSSNMYTTSKVVIENFSLSDGKAKFLNPELVRRIILRERERCLTIVFPLGKRVEDINWLE